MKTIRTRPTGLNEQLMLEFCRPAMSTGATSVTFDPVISPATRKPTSSPASEDGRSRSAASDGATTEPSGRQASLASHSPEQVSAEDSTTTDTSGRTSKSWSPSYDLQSCLESNLQTRLTGSELCEVVWVKWNTPWGQSRSRPLARVRSTADPGSTLWPTPTTSRGGSNSDSAAVSQRGHGTNLVGAVKASLWGTPRVTTNGGRGSPTAPEASRLEDQVQADSNGSSTGLERRGALHPEFAAWLMGYPAELLDAVPTAPRKPIRG